MDLIIGASIAATCIIIGLVVGIAIGMYMEKEPLGDEVTE